MVDADSGKTQVQDVVSTVRDTAQEQAGEVVEKGRGMLRSQVDSRSTQVGQQAQSLADTLRQTAGQIRESGDQQKARYADLADQGAQKLERTGRYLTETDADELLARVEDVARQQPWFIAGAGLLMGIAAARFMKASSTGRYQRSHDFGRRPYSSVAPTWNESPPLEFDAPPRQVVTPGRF